MKRVLVTGSSGFVGFHLCNYLHKKQYNVTALGREGENNPLCKNFINFELDEIPDKYLRNIEVCFHQAANNDTTDKRLDNILSANLYRPIKLFNKLIRFGCKKFIYASSCSVYGNSAVPYTENTTQLSPLNYYAYSKYMFEQFAESFSIKNNVSCVGLRYSNVYGNKEKHKNKRASMIFQLISKVLNKEEITLFEYGEQKRDWVFVKDVIKANILALKYKKSNVFNIGSGNSTSFNEIVYIIEKILSTKVNINYVKCPYDFYQNHTELNLDLSNKELGYYPSYNTKQGIFKLIDNILK